MSSTEETYARAVKSSHLKIKETPGDVDTIIAAGMSDSLGTLLMRLRAEFDAARRKMLVKSDTLTDRLLILAELRSLHRVAQALGEFGWMRVGWQGIDLTHAEVCSIVGHVLDVWLDRLCHHCDGRGFTGGYGAPMIRCRHCSETGNRRQGLLSRISAGQALAEGMLYEMDCAVEAAGRRMARLQHR